MDCGKDVRSALDDTLQNYNYALHLTLSWILCIWHLAVIFTYLSSFRHRDRGARPDKDGLISRTQGKIGQVPALEQHHLKKYMHISKANKLARTKPVLTSNYFVSIIFQFVHGKCRTVIFNMKDR